MNPKFFVVAVAIALVATLGVIATSGQALTGGLAGTGLIPQDSAPQGILPIEIHLKEILVQDVDRRSADIKIEFTVVNPNTKSVLLPFVSYHLYEGDARIHAGEIGERLESLVVGSNYVTLLSNQSVVIRDSFSIRNTGNTPEFWSSLYTDTAQWRVTGEATYALSSVTAGGQNELSFEFP